MNTRTRRYFERDWQPRKRASWLRRTFTIAATCLVLIATWSICIVLDARQRTPQILAQSYDTRPMPLTLQSFPPGYLDLLLAVQDPTFYNHRGVNFLARPGRMTTVTQSLVKSLYFERFEPGVVNKIRQTLIARYALDPMTSKEQQLTLFVNTVYLGSLNGWPVNGFEQGALIYFGRSLDALTRDEYVSLLAMLDAPNALNVLTQPAANAERVAQLRPTLDRIGISGP